MNYFLDFICQKVVDVNKISSQDIKDYCFVFPNLKLTNEFQTLLIKKYNKNALIFPKILNINQIGELYSGLTIPNDETLFFIIRNASKEVIEWNINDDSLYKKFKMIKNDFNIIDNGLIDGEKIFNYLEAIKRIDKKFEISENKLNKNINYEEEFIKRFGKLGELHKKTCDYLISNGIAYEGLLFRELAKNTEIKKSKFNKIFFCGLIELSKAQEKWIKFLISKDEAEFIINSDKYYLDDEENEVGNFHRNLINKGVAIKGEYVSDNLLNNNYEFNKVNCINPIEQIIKLSEILGNIDYKKNKILILPLDNNLKEEIIKILGSKYKLNSSNQNFTNKNLITENVKKILKFYLETTMDIFDKNNLNEISKYFNSKSISDLFNIKKEINLKDYLDRLNSIITEYKVKSNYEKELIRLINLEIDKLHNNLIQNKILKLDIEIINELIIQRIQNINFNYTFENDTNIYILNKNESLNLNFDIVFILSLNEGIFPSKIYDQTFLLNTVRKDFDITNIHNTDNKESIIFHNIIKEAKHIYLFSVENQEDYSIYGAESRYLLYIEKELIKKNNKIKLNNLNFEVNKIESNIFTKNEPDLLLLKENLDLYNKFIDKLKKGISFTNITTFLNCKRKFYLSYILNIKGEELNLEINKRIIGTLFHNLVEEVYKNVPLNLKYSEEEVKILVENQIKKLNNSNNFEINYDNGINYFYKSILIEGVKSFLNNELKTFDETNEILHIEKSFECDKEIILDDKNVIIKLKGKIDRIERKNNIIKVIDYKTSSFKELQFKKNDLSDIFDEKLDYKKYEYLLQLLFYDYILRKNNINANKFSIYFVLNPVPKEVIKDFEENVTNEFEDFIEDVLKSLLDINLNFVKTDNISECKFCDYNIICKRK